MPVSTFANQGISRAKKNYYGLWENVEDVRNKKKSRNVSTISVLFSERFLYKPHEYSEPFQVSEVFSPESHKKMGQKFTPSSREKMQKL
jgi:hypothetical protein